MKLRSIQEINVAKKRVFLRADLNIPLHNKEILQDYRIKALLPTIDYIHQHGGKVILATHIGRPNAHTLDHPIDEQLSTKILAHWFDQHSYTVDYEKDLLKAEKRSHQLFSHILLLENLRFFQGEQEDNLSFAQLLASLADVYINDAFGLIHRHDTSVTLLPKQFPPEKRGIGLLIEREISQLTRLTSQVQQPFVVVLGGSKMKDKVALLENFLQTKEQDRVRTLLIGGALAHAFLQAQGINIGKSLLDQAALPYAKEFLRSAEAQRVNLLLPQDFLVVSDKQPTVYAYDRIPSNGVIVDIGPATIQTFTKMIAQAGTIFANGTMGMYENPAFAAGSKAIIQAIADTSAYSVIGGGDAVAAAYAFNLHNDIDFLSTGGGATLAFLGAQDPEEQLPALKALGKTL